MNYFADANVLISKTSKKCDNDWFMRLSNKFGQSLFIV